MKCWSWLLVGLLAASTAGAEKKKDEKKAAKETVTAPAETPQDVVQQAEAKLAAGDAQGAQSLLEAAKTTDPRAALRLAVLHESRGALDDAIDTYGAAAQKLTGPEKGEALGRLALVQRARGMAEWVASAREALASDPEGAWPAVAASYQAAHERRIDEAIALARKAGTGAGAGSALGHALEAQGDMGGAEGAYREALAAEAGSIHATVGLATVLRRTGRAAEAEPMLAQVLDRAGSCVEALKEMARVKLALGRAQEALTNASLAAGMAENDPDAQGLAVEVKVGRALQDLAQGQVDVAIEDLTALCDKHPESAVARVGLGKAQIARRDAAAALATIEKAVSLEANDAEARYQLGVVHHTLRNDAASAVPPLDKAVSLEPANTLYRTALGAALVDSGDTSRAVTELTRVVEAPGYTGWQGPFYLGVAHLKGNSFKEASAALLRSLAVKPDNAQAEGLLAWCYVGLKDTENFKVHGANARNLGYKDPELMKRLAQVEAGQTFNTEQPAARPRRGAARRRP